MDVINETTKNRHKAAIKKYLEIREQFRNRRIWDRPGQMGLYIEAGIATNYAPGTIKQLVCKYMKGEIKL